MIFFTRTYRQQLGGRRWQIDEWSRNTLCLKSRLRSSYIQRFRTQRLQTDTRLHFWQYACTPVELYVTLVHQVRLTKPTLFNNLMCWSAWNVADRWSCCTWQSNSSAGISDDLTLSCPSVWLFCTGETNVMSSISTPTGSIDFLAFFPFLLPNAKVHGNVFALFCPNKIVTFAETV